MNEREASRSDWGLRNSTPMTDELVSGHQARIADANERIATALERILSKLQCTTTTEAARALIRMDKRMAKKNPLS